MRILGISAYYHDSAAALLADGEIVAAAQEERFTRGSTMRAFRPVPSLLPARGRHRPARPGPDRVLRQAAGEVRAPAGDLPELRTGWLRSFIAAMPVWLKEKLYLKTTLKREFCEIGRLQGARAAPAAVQRAITSRMPASAFFMSPHERAAVLCMDGVGEWATTSAWLGTGNQLDATLGNRFSALAGPFVFCLHLFHRLQGQLRRVQTDGPCALRPAEVRPI
jgi:carbamoyltransferase